MIIKYKVFQKINCFRFATVMNNTTVINTFNNDNSNITYIKTEPRLIIATIAYIIFKFESSIPLLKSIIL